MSPETAHRLSAAERRETVLDAALELFAERGYHGASTEEIARAAGISQPYVFRLFGSKRALFEAVIARCFRETLELFQRAAEGKRGEEALVAMGDAYVERLLTDRRQLLAQMQAYAACDDPKLRAAVRAGFGDLVAYVERVSGMDQRTLARFFAQGMLLNVFASMGLFVGDAAEPWAESLLRGCKDNG